MQVSSAPGWSRSRRSSAALAVCATPIGNLEDVTLRVLRELAEAELVLCEDTRRTRTLLDRHGVAATLLSYHRHNEARRTAELVPRLEAGERIALVSDAGLPGVNDPGARLIAAALEAGVPVTVLPGASAVETALVASGLAGERFQFLGYLPRGAQALAARVGRARRLAASGGRVRVAAATPGDASVARGSAAGPAGRRVSRADEALRGGGARVGRRRSRPGSRSRRRARSRSSSARARVSSRATPARRMRSPRSSSSSRPDCRAVRPPTSSAGWRAFPVTPCTRNRCKRAEPGR